MQPKIPPDSKDRLHESIACASCGHDLRWQRRDGNCPECGAAIEQSLREDRLIFADLRWLRRLWFCLLILQVLLIGWVLVGGILAVTRSTKPFGSGVVGFAIDVRDALAATLTSSADILPPALLLLTPLIAASLAAAMIKQPGAPRGGDLPRRMARDLAIATILVSAATPFLRLSLPTDPGMYAVVWQIWFTVSEAKDTILLVSFLPAIFYLSQLRRRLPECSSLDRATRRVGVGLAALLVLTKVALLLVQPLPWPRYRWLQDPVWYVNYAMVLVGPLLLAWWFVGVRRALRDAIRQHVALDSTGGAVARPTPVTPCQT